MKIGVNKFKWIACIVTLLLLCIISSDKPNMVVEQAPLTSSQSSFISDEASCDVTLSEPESDILTRLRDTNRWGLSSHMFHIRVSAGRTLSFSNLSQRIVRMAMLYLCGHTGTEQLNYAQCHTIASIRFHIGYFIYHRCQMRC